MKNSLLILIILFGPYALRAQPANDNPCGAITIPITQSVDGCTPVSYSVTGATVTNNPTTLCNSNPDVWYKFVTPNRQNLKIRAGTSNILFTTYTADNCSGTFTDYFACIDSVIVSTLNNMGVYPNTEYYLRITNINNSPNFNFSFCLLIDYPADVHRIGINTKFPQANLDVVGAALFRDSLSVNKTFRFFNGTQAANRVLTSDASGYANWANLPANYWSASGINIFNNNAGNIGIGNNTPSVPLSFANATGPKISLFSSGINTQYGIGVQGGLLQVYADLATSDIAFGSGGSNSFTERMRIKGNGNTGIGTINPIKQLEVIGAASATPVALVIGNRGGFGPAALEFVSDYGLTNQWRPGYIKNNDLGGFTGALEFYTNGTGPGNLYGNVKGFEIRNGTALTATGAVGSYSDERLKNTITAFTDGLNVINKINPVQFYYNIDAPFKTAQQQTGIIAQELEKAAPYMVEKNKQNGYDDLRSVNNQAYTYLLINAVKELSKQNADLQKRIEELERKLSK